MLATFIVIKRLRLPGKVACLTRIKLISTVLTQTTTIKWNENLPASQRFLESFPGLSLRWNPFFYQTSKSYPEIDFGELPKFLLFFHKILFRCFQGPEFSGKRGDNCVEITNQEYCSGLEPALLKVTSVPDRPSLVYGNKSLLSINPAKSPEK